LKRWEKFWNLKKAEMREAGRKRPEPLPAYLPHLVLVPLKFT